MKTFLVASSLLALAACSGPGQPSGATSSTPVSGITSSNGGGQRSLGNTPTVSVGTGGSSASGPLNSKGAAY